MSSKARRLAQQAVQNRANAQHSTGPVTETGKSISSQNATRHGLTSQKIVIPGEDQAEYDAMKTALYREYQPKAEIEKILLEEFAASIWRLARARRVETAFLHKLTEDSPDPDLALATALLEKPAEMNRLQRYITSIERAYNRAMTNLHNIVKARQQAEAKAAAIDPWLDDDGFVSQTPEINDADLQQPAGSEPPAEAIAAKAA